MTKKKLTVKGFIAIVVLTVVLGLLCSGFFFFTVLIVTAMTGNFVLAFIIGWSPALAIIVGLSISILLEHRREEEKVKKEVK